MRSSKWEHKYCLYVLLKFASLCARRFIQVVPHRLSIKDDVTMPMTQAFSYTSECN